MFKRIVSMVLSVAIIVTSPSISTFAGIVQAESEYSSEYSLPEELEGLDFDSRNIIEVTENEVISTDSDYYDIINIAEGKKLIFESGYITISENAVINGDIEVTGNASVNIYGTVNGCVTVTCRSAPEYHEDIYSGTLYRPSNFELSSGGVCDSVIISCYEGFIRIGGIVGSLTVLENAVCDMAVWGSSYIDTVNFEGNIDTWFQGQIGELHASSGYVNFTFAKVAKAYLEGTANTYIDYSSRLKELYVSGESVFVDNCGYIDNLACIGASFINNGEIGNAFVKDAWFLSNENSEHSYSSSFIIENMLCENSTVNLSRNEYSSLSGGVKYGSVTLSGGHGEFVNTIIESLYAYGSVDGINLDNIMINSAFLDFDVMENMNPFFIPDPESVFILNAAVSKKCFDAYYSFFAEMYDNKFDGVDVAQVIEKFITVKDIENQGVSFPETLNLSRGELVKVGIENGYAPCAAAVSSPDGEVRFITMDDGTFIADTDGEYSFTVYGAYYGCKVTTEIIQPLRMQINAYTGVYVWDIDGSYISNKSTNVTDFDISLFDITDNRVVNSFNIDKSGVLTLMPEYEGHEIKLSAVHASANWGNYWGYVAEDVTFVAGSGTIELVGLPYGEFSGYVNDSDSFGVYMYDSNGDYCGRAVCQDGSFWSPERFPQGVYQLVIINDPAGYYCFRRLSDFIRNGLINGRHFIQKEFVSTIGVQDYFYIDHLPNAPISQSPYIDYDNTMFKSHAQSSVQGGMVEFTLSYAFKENENISDAYAEISLPEGCEALGEIGSQDGILTLPLDLNENSISFTVVSDVENDNVLLNAALGFKVDGTEEYAYIGASGYSVVNLSMYAPTATGKSSVTLSGFATPGQTVSIYDGDFCVDQAVSSENGFWSCEAPLSTAYGKYHDITAVLYDGTQNEMRTATQTVYSSPIVPVVEEFNFNFYVHGHSASITLSSDEWCRKQWSYEYWPGSIFTFSVKLSNSDNIERMWISSNSEGRCYNLEGYYDEESGYWIASGQFCEDENYMPGGFAVGWQLKEDEITSVINRIEEIASEIDAIEIPEIDMLNVDDFLDFELPDEAVYDISDVVETEDGVSGTVTIDVIGNGDFVFDGDLTISKITGEKTVGDYISEGFTYDDSHNILYRIRYDDSMTSSIYEMINLNQYEEDNDIPLGVMVSNDKKVSNDQKVADSFEMLSWITNAGAWEKISEKLDKSDLVKNGEISKDYLKKVSLANKSIEYLNKLIYFVDMYKKLKEGYVRLRADELGKLRREFNEVYKNMRTMRCGCNHNTYECVCTTCSDTIKQTMEKLEVANDEIDALGQRYSDRIVILTIAILSVTTITFIGLSRLVKSPEKLKGDLKKVIKIYFRMAVIISIIDEITKQLGNWLIKQIEGKIKEAEKDYTDKMIESLKIAKNAIDIISNCGCGCAPPTTPETTPPNTGEPSQDSEPGVPHTPNNGDGGGDDGKPSGEDGGNSDNPIKQPDPSGYIYEAVESNRVSGVTATVYYQDSDRSEIKWNAETAGQVNPQLTDEEGKYGWNVPFGFWKVKVIGDNYEVTESQWMQVPPPRVDVNLAITSLAPANVKRVSICEDFAEIEFDKYMDVSTMSGIISIDGKAYDAVPVNEEISGLGDGRSFATVFRATLDTKAVNSQSYSVQVKSAMCYANVQSKEYSGTVVCAPIATSLSASIPGGYAASGNEITISVALETAGGFENIAAPQVTFDKPEMAKVVSIGDVDAAGKTDIVIKTAMAGMVNMNITVPGSSVSETISLPVVRDQDSQLVKALSPTSADTNGAVSVVVVIVVVLAAVLFICIVLNITASILQSRARRKKESKAE